MRLSVCEGRAIATKVCEGATSQTATRVLEVREKIVARKCEVRPTFLRTTHA